MCDMTFNWPLEMAAMSGGGRKSFDDAETMNIGNKSWLLVISDYIEEISREFMRSKIFRLNNFIKTSL